MGVKDALQIWGEGGQIQFEFGGLSLRNKRESGGRGGGTIDFANLGARGSEIFENQGAGGQILEGGGLPPPGHFLMEQPS